MASIQYYSQFVDVEPKAGSVILIDGRLLGSKLEACEIPDFAPFRLPSGPNHSIKLACRVEITGRKVQRRPYRDEKFVRVSVTFVGDCEPDTIVAGWMAI